MLSDIVFIIAWILYSLSCNTSNWLMVIFYLCHDPTKENAAASKGYSGIPIMATEFNAQAGKLKGIESRLKDNAHSDPHSCQNMYRIRLTT